MDYTLDEWWRLPGSATANLADLEDKPAKRAGTSPNRGTLPLVGVIRNPRSHRNRGQQAEAVDAPNVLTSEPKSRADLAATLADFAARGIDLLVVDGGDGTVRDVLTCGAPAFGDDWPDLIVLPKGKTNALIGDLGMPKAWPLAEALRATHRTRIVRRRPIVVERRDESGKRVMGFIIGTGVFNAAIEAGQVAHRFGAFQSFAVAVTVVMAVMQALFGIGRSRWRATSLMRLRLGPDGRSVAHSGHAPGEERFAAGFSTLDGFPLGMKPFGREPGEGIRFVAVDAPLRRVVAMVPMLLMGWDRPGLVGLGVHRGAASEIAMDLGDGFVLDGEHFPSGSYRLSQGPELRFLVP